MAIPSTPQNMILQQGNGQILISWDFSAGADYYSVSKSTDGVIFNTFATPTTNFYVDTNVTVGTLIYYRVASNNGSGTSAYTNPQIIVPALTGDMSLMQLRLLAQQKADMENSNFVSKSEWNTYINQSAFELYDLLITLYEDYYVKAPLVYVTDGTTVQYTLPTDFYKLLGVDCGIASSSNAWVTLKKFDFISRNRFVFSNVSSTYLGVFNLQYRLVGNTLYFIPTPSGGQSIRVWYIPKMTELLQDNDLLTGISGWTEYVIVDAAIKGMQKEESDVTVLLLQKQALMKRIEDSAMNRDAGQPDTISNTRTWGERWGTYGGAGFDGSFGGY